MSMLCGFFEPSAGTALVEGYDITKDMDSVCVRLMKSSADSFIHFDSLSRAGTLL